MKINYSMLLIAFFLLFFSCEKNNLENSTTYNNNYKFKIEENETDKIFIIDENNIPLKFDDEMNYKELEIFPQCFFAKELLNNELFYYYEKNLNKKVFNKDMSVKMSYNKNFVSFFNDNINNVFNLPSKNEDIYLNEAFNKVYYDYKDCNIVDGKKEYGLQEYYFIKGDVIEYKTNMFGENYINALKVSFARDKKTGNLIIKKY